MTEDEMSVLLVDYKNYKNYKNEMLESKLENMILKEKLEILESRIAKLPRASSCSGKQEATRQKIDLFTDILPNNSFITTVSEAVSSSSFLRKHGSSEAGSIEEVSMEVEKDPEQLSVEEIIERVLKNITSQFCVRIQRHRNKKI